MGVFALLSILSFPAVVVEAQDPPPKLSSFTGGEYIKPCTPGNGNRFLVNVEGTNINVADGESKCPYLYNNNDQSINDWKAINGKQFKNLETNRFLFQFNSVTTKTPTRIRVKDTASANKFNCGRALWQDKYQDFKFEATSPLLSGITSVPSSFPWWPVNNKDPVQMTIVPFLGTPDPTSSNCSPINDSSFSTKYSIAVWLSTDTGVVTAPANTKYCNVARSAEIDDCLNLPYWIVDTPPAGGISTITLVGSLYDTLKTTTENKDVSIYVPKKTNIYVPINNMEQIYNIVPGVTNVEDCKKWAAKENEYAAGVVLPNNNKCLVNGYTQEMTPTTRKVTVSGTGRIFGGYLYGEFPFQDVIGGDTRNNGGLPTNVGAGGYDLNSNISGTSTPMKEVPRFLVFANLLAVSSARTTAARGTQLCSATTAAIHVQGVEVASGSRCVYKYIYVYIFPFMLLALCMPTVRD